MAVSRRRGFIGSPRESSFWSLLSQKLVVWAGDLYGFMRALCGVPSSLQRWGSEPSLHQGPERKGICVTVGRRGHEEDGLGARRGEVVKGFAHTEPRLAFFLIIKAKNLQMPTEALRDEAFVPSGFTSSHSPLTHSIPATPDTSFPLLETARHPLPQDLCTGSSLPETLFL